LPAGKTGAAPDSLLAQTYKGMAVILLHFHPIDIGYGRYDACLAHFVPWLQRYYNHLTPQVLLEIGAGAGSSTAAFARMCGEKTG
jgi:hypothetical protein